MTQPTTTMLKSRAGLAFEVRPAQDRDEAALADFFAHVSKDDLRFRFLSSLSRVSDKQISEMTHVDHRRTEDFLVFAPGTGTIVANAMVAADKALEVAEIAISVHSDYKGKGIEEALIDHVRADAKNRGFKKLMSIENRENHDTIDLERRKGFTARGLDGDPTLLVLETAL